MRAHPFGTIAILATVVASATLAARWSPSPLHGQERRFYRRLDKPGFTPPDPVFAVWGPLYGLTTLAGWRLWHRGEARPLAHWFAVQALNPLWLWLGFGQRRLGAASAAAAASFGNAAALVATAYRRDRLTAGLAAPLALWLGYAATLTMELWRRNR